MDVGLFPRKLWQGVNDERLVVIVNYAANQSQCYIRIPLPNLRAQAMAAGRFTG